MQYLFNNWSALEKRLKEAGRILLCADFDGTVTPIRPRPKDAELSKESRLLLRRLSKNNLFFVGIISGRGLKDIREKVGVRGLIYAGNHGLEIAYGIGKYKNIRYHCENRTRVIAKRFSCKKESFVHPAAKRFIPVISEISRSLKRGLAPFLAPFSGAILEEKLFSLSLHHRLVKKEKLSRLKKIFLQTVKPYLTARKVKLTYGKKVWEVRPPIEWDKGKAVVWLAQRLKAAKALPVYIGDDLTDEDGFRAVNKMGGLSVVVGRKRSSSARYYLKSAKDVQKFLEEIEKIKRCEV